jgi:hypothetical protein
MQLGFTRTVIGLWHSMAHDLFGSYHPELHYMRGPGPKCREKLRAETARQAAPQTEAAHAIA